MIQSEFERDAALLAAATVAAVISSATSSRSAACGLVPGTVILALILSAAYAAVLERPNIASAGDLYNPTIR